MRHVGVALLVVQALDFRKKLPFWVRIRITVFMKSWAAMRRSVGVSLSLSRIWLMSPQSRPHSDTSNWS